MAGSQRDGGHGDAWGAVPACRHSAVLPLGTNNNTRLADSAATSTWAQAVEQPGLPNLHKVSDDLYRGAQPTAEGIKQLQALGIKTIINLRSSDTDRDLLSRRGSHTNISP